MKMKLSILGLLSLYSFAALAESEMSVSSSVSDYARFKNDEFNSVFFTLGYRTNKTFVLHNETSGSTGFESLDTKTEVINDSLELGVSKEFFQGHRLSLSLFASTGVDTGRKKKDTNNFNYTDTLSGSFYTYGTSLNLNFDAFSMKVQPYVFTGMSHARNNFVLKYKAKDDSSASSTQIKYDRTSVDMMTGLGIRFIDPSTQISSYLSVSQLRNISENNKATATIGDNDVVINKEAKFTNPNYVISLGMGFFF